jgi:hypothetical protein
MFKKLNTRILLIVLLVLGGFVAVNKFFLAEKTESTFRSEFVKVDTALVSEIFIYPRAENGNEIKLVKSDKGWEVFRVTGNKLKAKADSNVVRGLLASFLELKSLSLAGSAKSSWDELQVGDTSGSRIKFVQTDGKTFDMVVGKFGYNPQTRSGTTCIRHASETETYTVDGFLSFTVNQGFNSWRNKAFLIANKENWTSLTFTYPGDSSYILEKQNLQWTVNGALADSSKTVQYLDGISNLQSSGFAEGYTPSSTPFYSLTIRGNNQPAPLTVIAYPADSIQKFILHSSQNPDAYFVESQSNFVSRIFVSRGNFEKME